jgi:hypothetical protein
MRRPNAKYNKKASDFAIRPQCKGNYFKSAIQYHYKRYNKKNSAK